MRMRLAFSERVPAEIDPANESTRAAGGSLGSTGSISVFIAYPERLEGQEPPDWAAKAFHEDEVAARFALNAVRTGVPAEFLRETGAKGFWGAWWAVEIRQKRSK